MSEKLSRDEQQGVSVPNREQVAEALATTAAVLQQQVVGCDEFEAGRLVLAAARAWLDQGDALVIRKDENGNWPITNDTVEAAAQAIGWNIVNSMGECRTLLSAALDALVPAERSPNERLY